MSLLEIGFNPKLYEHKLMLIHGMQITKPAIAAKKEGLLVAVLRVYYQLSFFGI